MKWAKDVQRMKQAENAQGMKWPRKPEMLYKLAQQECWAVKTIEMNNI